MFELSKAVRPNILSLQPYRCARDDYSEGILLDANENSMGPSLVDSSAFGSLNRYPDPHQHEVKELLCTLRKIPSSGHFFLGVGSDECIDMCLRVFVAPGKEKILITPPTYGMYAVAAQVNDVGVVKVPLDSDFQLDTAKILDAVKTDPTIKIIMVCSPGNPTGSAIRRNDIVTLLTCPFYRGVVIVDEAYIDFCVDTEDTLASVATLVLEYPNLIVSQTLSKAFGLAGIRLGFTISSVEIARIFNNTKAPYNISTPASHLAISALSSAGLGILNKHVAMIKDQRTWLMKEILKLSFVKKLLGSNDANFILAEIVDNSGVADNVKAHNIYKTMAERDKIVVRFRGNEVGCAGCLRITVGTQHENEMLIQKLHDFE